MDDALIEQARGGDKAALEQLLTDIAPAVHRFGLRMCRNEADAQDVLQDTLISVVDHLNQFQARSSLTSWVFALTRSACARRRRGLKNRPAESDATLAESSDPASSPERDAEQRQLSDMLAKALDSLSDEYREVIALRDIEGLSAKEASDALGISVEALKSRLHRARDTLRNKLKPLLEPTAKPTFPSCPDIIALFSRKLEDELTTEDCAAAEGHVSTCPSCSAVCDALQKALIACARERTREPSAEVRAAIIAAVAACTAR